MAKRSRAVDSKKLEKLRLAKGWSHERLAAETGLSKRTIERLEKGEPAFFHTIHKVAQKLGVEPQALCDAAVAPLPLDGQMVEVRPPNTQEPEHTQGQAMYIHPNGWFQKEGDIWKEHRKDAPDRPFTFKEFRRDNDYIYMYDASRAKDPGRPMYLRIPIEGGGVQWTYPNPLQWEDVMVVDARLENDAGDLRVTDLC